MAISEITIDTIEPLADGKVFGAAGSYIRIKGIAKGEINPLSPENHVIADLDKAPRNAVGMVEYETDFFILRPAEPDPASGVLVYDVTNRGRKMIFNLLDDASGNADTNDPKKAQDVGLGLYSQARLYPRLVWLMRRTIGSPFSSARGSRAVIPLLARGAPESQPDQTRV